MNTTDIPYTSKSMITAMSNRQKVQEGLYYSGLDHIELIMDIDLMIKEAKLTDKQLKVVELYFFKQFTQEEVSRVMNISQQAVLDHLKKVKFKIGKVLERWKSVDDSIK